MIHGIASLGPREHSSSKSRILTAGAHIAGGAVGGATLATVAWFGAAPVRTLLPGELVVVLLVIVVINSAAHDLRLKRNRVTRTRQVPATWRHRYGHYRAFAAFGATLGAGLLTFVPYAITYVVFVAAAVELPIGDAVACGVAFGVSRTGAAALSAARAPSAGRMFQRVQAMRWLTPAVSVMVSMAVLIAGATGRLAW